MSFIIRPESKPKPPPPKTKVASKGMMSLFAICPGGLDEVLKREIEALGAGVLAEYPGGIEFEGDLDMAYNACLSLRTASRVLLLLKKTNKVFNPDELYQAVQEIDWFEVFQPNCTFAIYFTETKTKERREPMNLQFWALKAKDAIVDQFRVRYQERPSVDRKDPDITIRFHIHDQMLKIYLDLSGVSLHERGYRSETLEAPMKENLAAGLLLLAGWDKAAREKIPFFDPFCGSGTLLIEAAMIATNTAPGLYRHTFGFYSWKKHDSDIFEAVHARLKAKRILDAALLPDFLGSDASSDAIRVAIKNTTQAGFQNLIRLQQASFENTLPFAEKGMIVTNPPYGVRIGETEALLPVYQAIGSTLKHKYKGWTCGFITSDKKLLTQIALKPSKKVALHNGGLESVFSVFELY
jgi:23S rRNA (guanine2445-N2)-methyltransferase / 23S rRNA (guanine2069-N7)-methyltransferase